MPGALRSINIRRMNEDGKIKIHFLIWPSIIISLILTVLLNLIFNLFV